MLMCVTMHVLMCEYVNLSMSYCVCAPIYLCFQQSYLQQFLPPNFTASRSEMLRNHDIFRDFKTALPAAVSSER